MIYLGPAGTGSGSLEGLQRISDLKLEACEIEFTYGVRMSNALAKQIGELNKKLRLQLSVHAPYYINLASLDKTKIIASKKRILDSCERGRYMGAKYIVFHAGFYQGREPEEVYQLIKNELIDLQKTIKKKRWHVKLAPETTGKNSQFGTVDELLRLVKETHCSLCIDFAHIYARQIGKINYDELFKKLKHFKHIHAHFAGIEYTEKGERKHKLTPADKLKELFKYIKKYRIDTTIINESPDPIGDSVLSMKLR